MPPFHIPLICVIATAVLIAIVGRIPIPMRTKVSGTDDICGNVLDYIEQELPPQKQCTDFEEEEVCWEDMVICYEILY